MPIFSMTVRFASARRISCSPVARSLARRPLSGAANDDANPLESGLADPTLHAALLHFAAYGLGAAQAAKDEAEGALAAGDRARFDHWLAVCHRLDRRLARQFVRRSDLLPG